MQPYTFFLSPYPYLEPTLLSGRDWANRVKVRRDKGLRESRLERSLF